MTSSGYQPSPCPEPLSELDRDPDRRQTQVLDSAGNNAVCEAAALRLTTRFFGGKLRTSILLFTGLCFGIAFGQQTAGTQAADTGGYTGPAVLSKAGSPLGTYVGDPISFRWYASTLGTYTTDLTQPITDQQGDLTKVDAYGGSARVGVYGAKNGPHDTLGLDFAVGYRAYAGYQRQRYNGVDLRLSTNYSRQVSVRTAIEVGLSAASYNYLYGDQYRPVIGNPGDSELAPAVDGFDGRTSNINGRAGVLHNLSQRWYLSFFGGGHISERHSNALVSSRTANAGVNAGYMLNEKSAVGVGYDYRYFFFTGDFGSGQYHSAYGFYSKQLSPLWTFSGRFGVSRFENKRTVAVPLDPILAAIVGQATTLEPIHKVNWGPAVGATLGRRFERSSLSIFYNHDFGVGNSYITDGTRDTFGAFYSYNATSRLNFGIHGSYYRINGITQGDIVHQNFGAGVGMNYRLTSILHLTSSVGYYIQRVDGSNFDRNRFHATVGLSFSPGERPLSIF